MTNFTQKFFIQWTTSKIDLKKIGTKNYSDTLIMSDTIANVTLLHHRLNKIKHCFVIGQQNIDSCVNIVILTVVIYINIVI